MAAMARHGGGSVALELRRGEPKAVEEALRVIVDVKAEKLLRLQYTEISVKPRTPRRFPYCWAL